MCSLNQSLRSADIHKWMNPWSLLVDNPKNMCGFTRISSLFVCGYALDSCMHVFSHSTLVTLWSYYFHFWLISCLFILQFVAQWVFFDISLVLRTSTEVGCLLIGDQLDFAIFNIQLHKIFCVQLVENRHKYSCAQTDLNDDHTEQNLVYYQTPYHLWYIISCAYW